MFRIAYSNGGFSPAVEYVPAQAAIALGQALVYASGKVSVCGATAAPEFIAVEKYAGGAEKSVAVIRVTEDVAFEVPCTEATGALKPGDKVTISEDGLQVTATTENGVFTVDKVLDSGLIGFFRR